MTDDMAALRQALIERRNTLGQLYGDQIAEAWKTKARFDEIEAIIAEIDGVGHEPAAPAPKPRPKRAARGDRQREVLDSLAGADDMIDSRTLSDAHQAAARALVKAGKLVRDGMYYRLPSPAAGEAAK